MKKVKMQLGKSVIECLESEKQTMLNRGYVDFKQKPIKESKTDLKEGSKNGKA